MCRGLISDAKNIAGKDPAARSIFEVMMLYQGFHAVVMHRMANYFFRHGFIFTARLISQINRFITGIEIHPGARIGRGLFIDHGMGVVIGETAEIGDNCTIYHGVTLGGTGKDTGKRHPTIGNNVLIGAGSIVLGPVSIGNNAMIGAGSVVMGDVEANTTVTGTKARPVKRDGRKIAPSDDLDQIHLPDPLCQEICRLQIRLDKLEKQLQVKEEDKPETGQE